MSSQSQPRLGGTIAASVTPLRADGEALDEQAIFALVDWLCQTGIDGIFALGTTGEGMLLDVSERKQAAEAFVRSVRGRLSVVIHCGAQTTRQTTALAFHAATSGADAVAVIAPPYFALDRLALLAHFTEAARACEPLPFFIYEFAARSGYAVPIDVIEELRLRLSNLRGLKVSDSGWERFEPYLLKGLDVFVGPEPLIDRGLKGGAVGAVSGLAAALPEVVVEAVKRPSEESAQRVETLRLLLEQFPFHAALKRVLVRRGVKLQEAVRAPLRRLSNSESEAFDRILPAILEALASVRGENSRRADSGLL